MQNSTQAIHLKFGSIRCKQETAATTKKWATLHRPTYYCHAKQYLESTHSRLLFINRPLFLDVLYDLFAIGNVDMENAPRHPVRLKSIPHKRQQKNIDVSPSPVHLHRCVLNAHNCTETGRPKGGWMENDNGCIIHKKTYTHERIHKRHAWCSASAR